MIRKFTALLLTVCMLGTLLLPVHAKTFTGDENWQVNFTPEAKMESNFTTANLGDLISGMQPGDDAIITLALQNSNSATTNWYMTNEVLSSLEDSVDVASGGAYTYRLAYVGPDGEEDVLFDSDTVGGDTVGQEGEGLNEVTDALEDYFFLDTLNYGQSGAITLRVALDGETQGNDYQDTVAKLQMNFAVELKNGASKTPTIVNTGDMNLVPYIIAAAVSGLLLLLFAIYSRTTRKKKGEP